MILIISDLHFSDVITALNLNPRDWQLLCDKIRSRAKSCSDLKEIKIVLFAIIFSLIRSFIINKLKLLKKYINTGTYFLLIRKISKSNCFETQNQMTMSFLSRKEERNSIYPVCDFWHGTRTEAV